MIASLLASVRGFLLGKLPHLCGQAGHLSGHQLWPGGGGQLSAGSAVVGITFCFALSDHTSNLCLLGVTSFWCFFAYVSFLKKIYPTIELVTFRLHGMCMLDVFLLLAFACLGHECRDLLSSCHGMHVCTDWTLVCNLIGKTLGEWSPILSPNEKSSLLEGQRRVVPAAVHHAGQ